MGGFCGSGASRPGSVSSSRSSSPSSSPTRNSNPNRRTSNTTRATTPAERRAAAARGEAPSSAGGVQSAAARTARSAARGRRPSAGRGSNTGNSLRQTGKNLFNSFTTDLKMGLSTFGQTGERQAQSLRDQGYSERAIQSYQERTAATRERMRQEQMARSDDNDSSPAPVTTAAAAPAPAPAPTTTTPTPPPAPAPISEDTSAPEEGSTEAEVIASAERRRGRRATIETTPQGLITAAKTRRRQSLMSGRMIT